MQQYILTILTAATLLVLVWCALLLNDIVRHQRLQSDNLLGIRTEVRETYHMLAGRHFERHLESRGMLFKICDTLDQVKHDTWDIRVNTSDKDSLLRLMRDKT